MSVKDSDSWSEHYSPFFSERREHLHAMLVGCGHQRTTQPSYSWDGLRRGQNKLVIWQYTLNGMGRLRFGENEYPVTPGTAMLLVVPENHCYYLPENSPSWEFLFVTVHGSELVRLVTEIRNSNGFLLHHTPDSLVVQKAWTILSQCRKKHLNDCYIASSVAYEFVMALFSESSETTSSEDSFLKQVHAYALEHISQPLGVGDLATATGCSRWHFSRRFQQLEGISPSEFISNLKMRLAVRLLQTTNDPVKVVAESCGFTDASYFCKVFRNHYGLSPAGFRSGKKN